MKTQTFARNNVTITFPAGYKDVNAYLATLKINLKLAQGPAFAGSKDKAKQAKGQQMITTITAQIAEVEKALA